MTAPFSTRDIVFALGAGAAADRLEHWDADLATTIVQEAAKLAEREIWPIDTVGDREGACLEDGCVRLPPAFATAYRHYRNGGWTGLSAPEDAGGQGMPHVLWAAISEMLSASCVSFQMLVTLGHAAQRAILTKGSDAQRATWLPRIASGEYLATMCLSEPQAGSDLSRISTRAEEQADGTWRLRGRKTWISGGDQNMSPRILHLVLARCAGKSPGHNGLGLFLVPSDAGRAANAIHVDGIEDKLGMHASPTCSLRFDGAIGEIVGAPGEGLANMFAMMNVERLDIAAQGIGLAQKALTHALDYAAERDQGRRPGANAPHPIRGHGDVARMLLEPLAQILPLRALVYRCFVDLEDPSTHGRASLLTPVLKAFATELANHAAANAIQIHGGYGFTRDFPVEQIYRDARITTIYEGTNGIQAMTLATRLLRVENGSWTAAFQRDLAEALGDDHPNLEDWRRATDKVLDLEDPGLVAQSYLRLTALVALAAQWERLAPRLDEAPAPRLYRSAHRFFSRWLLPETALLLERIRAGTRDFDLAALEEART